LVQDKRGKAGEQGAWQVLRKNLIERMKIANSDDWHKCEVVCMDCFNHIHQKSIHGRVKTFLKYRSFTRH